MGIEITPIDDFIALDIPDEPSLLGEGLIVPQGRVIIYGAPGHFKSFAAMQLCYALSQGKDWLGYETKAKSTILYLQAEIVPKMMQGRAFNMQTAFGLCPNFWYGYIRDFSLQSEQSWTDLADAVAESDCNFVFLDPMSQLLPGSEIDDKVMRDFLRGLDILSTHTDVGLGIVHHSRKTVRQGDGTDYVGAEDLRGWSGLIAWADSIIRLRRLHNLPGTIELSWEKIRHGPEVARRWLRFDDESGILMLSESDPEEILEKLLKDGPRPIKEVDEVLKKEAGLSPLRCIKYRQELEQRNFLEQYKSPVNKKIHMLRLK